MYPILRWPSAIKCWQAFLPPLTSSTTTRLTPWIVSSASSTSTTWQPDARRRSTWPISAGTEIRSTPSTRRCRAKSRKIVSWLSGDSRSKTMRSYPLPESAETTPRRRWIAEGRVKKGTTAAIVRVLPRERRRAIGLGLYSRSAIASCTRARVASRTLGALLSTRETVPNPTPAFLATSLIVGDMERRLEPVP